MATKEAETKTSNTTRTRQPRRKASGAANERSAFFNAQTGAIVGAAVAGAAVGFAANLGRKLIVQSPGLLAGNWDEALKAEHAATLAVFDQIEATTDEQVGLRTSLLAHLKHALAKHAFEEENVIYPALRDANEVHDADALNSEHGYVKQHLYDLEQMDKASPEFLDRIRAFRTLLSEHIRNEEDMIFPRLVAALSDEQNAKLTKAMNREGLKLA